MRRDGGCFDLRGRAEVAAIQGAPPLGGTIAVATHRPGELAPTTGVLELDTGNLHVRA